MLPFIYMALAFSYMSLMPSSKLPFKTNAWDNDEGKLEKDVNGINPKVQRNQKPLFQNMGRAGAGIHNFYPHTIP